MRLSSCGVAAGSAFIIPRSRHLCGGAFATFSDVDGNSFELLGSDEMSREIEAPAARQRREAGI